MKSVEQQLKALLERVNRLEGIVIEGNPPPTPGIEEWQRVVEEIAGGNADALTEFKRRGGKVPPYIPLPREARAPYQPRKRVERPEESRLKKELRK